MLPSMQCCLNPRVMGGLVAAGLVLWIVAPATTTAALPLLLALVCPLSMGVMMWRMSRGVSCAAPGAGSFSAAGPVDLDEELRQAREELAIARAERQLGGRDEQTPPDRNDWCVRPPFPVATTGRSRGRADATTHETTVATPVPM